MGMGVYVSPKKVQPKSYNPQVKAETVKIEQAVKMIAAAKRPLIYAGGGVVNSGPQASKLLTQFTRMTGFPCTLTLMGLGIYPASDKQYLGMVGMHGTYESNLAMHHCDLMIAIGSRFDDRITGRIDGFSPGSKKIHIDIDPSSINKNIAVDLPIVGDVKNVLGDLIKEYKAKKVKQDQKALSGWWRQINSWRKQDCLNYDRTSETTIKPQYAIERLYQLTRKHKDVRITTEVGQHQMWAAQHFHFDKPNQWMTSGGLGTMGYGLPAAVGAQVANPDALCIDIAGEASILMNIQELATVAQYRLPVKVFILNNQYMGMVRQWQELLHGSRYSESYMDSLPDFVKLAEAFGLVGMRATNPKELDQVIKDMIKCDKSVVCDICVDQMENVYPMIPSGAAHNEMLLGPDDQADKPVSEKGMVLV